MGTRKFYQVGYTKKAGGRGIMIVKARNRTEALANAKDNRYTGSKFYVMRELKSAKHTAKGGGSHRANR
ncbi:MAG: hypothetical protein PHS33_08465 [Candidatus Omnitrophica bacterium]|nr:hypothetical protein [Candidatus Omnitrophota bacterium]